MKYIELENKAREVCPQWLKEEVDAYLKMVEAERECDKTSWGDIWNFFTVLESFEWSDLGQEHCFKIAMTKMQRHIGVYEKVDGKWQFNNHWHQLIN